ncbi:hypothetical protein K2173_006001 [Erythroxylum novogranatense]|uniref:Pentapeptide repeat-containing protein n=1 Tax=Erythroxylum novogranatense TaxID=1862640 RepID=A0AAV8TBP4_9ROSI|nr:hypothetical protein K2173_006001 [Erythroxylum novogranatense]
MATVSLPLSRNAFFTLTHLSNIELNCVTCGILAAWIITTATSVIVASQRLPPLSTEPNRCERAFVGNTIGQANGVYDKLVDLRFCDYTNDKSNRREVTCNALMSDAKFDGVDMSKCGFLQCCFGSVNFGKAELQGAIFKNTVLSGSTFEEAHLENAVFEDTIIGYIDFQKLCTNTTISTEGRADLGCR